MLINKQLVSQNPIYLLLLWGILKLFQVFITLWGRRGKLYYLFFGGGRGAGGRPENEAQRSDLLKVSQLERNKANLQFQPLIPSPRWSGTLS